MQRLRFSRAEIDATVEAVRQHMVFKDVPNMRVARLKRFMARPTFAEELELHRVDCSSSHGMLDNYEFLKRKQEEFANEPIIPPPLVRGDDLIALGMKPGPRFGEILEAVETRQLEGDTARPGGSAGLGEEGIPDCGRTRYRRQKRFNVCVCVFLTVSSLKSAVKSCSMKILMISSEGWPLARSGALADVLVALPRELKARGHEIALAMPYYREIRQNRKIRTKPLRVSLEISLGEKRLTATCSKAGRPRICRYFSSAATSSTIAPASIPRRASLIPITPPASSFSAKPRSSSRGA